MTVFSAVFVAMVILLYFFEIKWRKKHNKPLNKGKPIDGGQFIVFWVLGSIAMFFMATFGVFFMQHYWESSHLFFYAVFEHIYSPIYRGYVSSESDILKVRVPYFIETYKTMYQASLTDEAKVFEFIKHFDFNKRMTYEEIAASNQDFVEVLYLYREQIMLVTSISLIFGRKFIYAPFFELKKTEGFVINKISLLLQLLLTVVFMGGIVSFIFLVPIHHETCPQRSFSFWCMDLGGRGWRYFWFPTLLLFYWMFFLMMINGFTHAVLTEFGYAKPKPEEEIKAEQTAD